MSLPTILCADDERNVLLTLRVQLQRHFPNCTIEIAETGREALELVKTLVSGGREVPLVIAGSIQLEQGNSFLLELHRRYPQILKVLLVGSASTEEMIELVNQDGLYRCLTSPWHEAELQQMVDAALQRYLQPQPQAETIQSLLAANAELKQQLQQYGQERQQSQQQLQLFVEHAPAAIAMLDCEMRYILASQRWKTDYNLGEQSIIGRSHYEVFPEIPDRWKAIHQRCLAGATERAEEDYFVRADGSVTWNQWEIHPWYTETGEIGGIIMFTQVFTDRKLAQLALQESEARNRAILSAVPDIMTIISADGHYLDVSFNQFAGEIIPMKLNGHVTEVLPPEAAHSCLNAIRQALQTGETQIHEHQILFGEQIQYEEVRIVPYQSDKVLCMVRDVTARKQAEFHLQESERRLSMALSAAKAGSWEWNIITNQTYWSDENFRLMGYEPGTVDTTYGTWLRAVHPADREQVDGYVASVVAEDQNLNLEYRVLLPDGSVRWLHDIGQLIKDDQGNPTGMIGIQIDITARKQAEVELQRREAQLTAIAASVPGGVFRIVRDAGGAYSGLFASEGHRTLCGMSPERLNAQPDLFITMVHPDDRQEHIAAWNAALQASSMFRRESRYVLSTGEVKWISIRAQFQRQDNGDVIIDGLVLDVTERKQIEQEILQSRDLREAIFNELADALFLVDPQTLLTLDCNQKAVELFEAEAKDALINIEGHTLQRRQFTSTELTEIAAEIADQEFWSREIEYVTLKGKYFWGNIAAKRIQVAGQSLNLVRVTDISARKQAEAQLEAQNSLLARIAQGAPLPEILHQVITRIEQQVPGAMGSVLLLDEMGHLRHGAAPHLPVDYLQAVDGVRIGPNVGACGTAAYLKQTIVSVDIATDPRWSLYREFTLAQGLQACWSIPLIAADGQVLGTFGLYYAEPRIPQGNELERISQIANIAGIAIERDRAAAAIRRSEEQLKLTLDFTGIGAWSWIPSTDEYVWNQQMVELLEIPLGLNNMFQVWCDRIHPDDVKCVQASIQAALTTQNSFAEEYRYQLQDGRWVWRWFKGQGTYTETGELERVLGIVQDITERKQAEEALAALEAEQRSILENIPGFVAKVDQVGTMLFLNRTAPGFTMTDVIGRNLDEFTAPESRQLQREALAQVFVTGVAATVETVGVGADQTLAYYEVRIAPVFQQDQVEAAIMVVTDITARKKVEVALRQSEAKQRALISALPDLIMRISADGVYLDFFAPSTFHSIGCTGDFVGTRVDESLPPHLARKRMNAIRNALRTGELQVYEQEIVVNGLPQIEECRVVVCGANEVLVIGRDISGRKQAELALRESEERRRLALDLTATGSWEFRVTTGETTWSDSHYRLMGLVPGEQPSNDQTWRERVHPEDLEWVEQEFAQALATHTLLDTEYRVTYPDGTVRWMLTKGQGIYNAAGEALRMVGVMTDITDRKLAEQALQQLNEELELRVQQRTQDLLESQAQLQIKEQFLRGIFEGTDNPIFVVDVLEEGRFEFTGWNRASELISGVSSAVALGQSPQELFPGEVGVALANNYQRCCNAGEMIRYEEHLTFETGDAWTLTTLTPLKNAQSRIYRMIGSVFEITERKQAEIQLQEAQRFAQSIADSTPNIIYIYDLEANRNIYTNREVATVLGYTSEAIQAMGNAFLKTSIHPDDFAQCMQYQQQVQALVDGEVLEIEYRMQHADGTWRWLSDRISAFKRNAAGNVIQYIGTAQDITDRKQAEAALAEKNTILRSVIECTPDVVYVKDAAGRYVIVNSGFANFFGRPSDQLLGQTDADLLPAETAAQMIANDRRTIASGTPQTIEEIVPRPDGDLRVYLTTKAPWHIPQGNQIGIVGLARDITERKQAEQALFNSEQRYATLAAAAPVGIYRTNLQGECLYVNERWCEISGLTSAEAMGMGWLKSLHPDDCDLITQTWNCFVQTGERFRLEYRFQRPDGTATWVFGQAVQERDENGIVKGYVGTITDISDRKRLEQDLLQINAELEQRVVDRTQDLQHAMEAAQTANRAKSTFLANMSHELRTPLNAILGFSQLLNRDYNLTTTQQEQVNVINRSGGHLLNLINDVLAMSKIEAGQTTLVVSCFNLRELLKDLEELFRLKAQAKQLPLMVQIDPTVPQRIQTDEGKLRQVLINLISNAIKFTHQGSVTVRVRPNQPGAQISTQISTETWLDLRFEVEDTGVGIAPDEQDKVFEPFEQTQSGRDAQEGTGLGMSISRQFVQLMQGELCFDSVPNQGTNFYFTIPVLPVATETTEREVQAAKVIGLAADQPTCRLLVVEDNADNRQFLVQLLRSVGFDVQVAVNGQEAVELWQSWTPHLIWMDIRMPILDGYQATQQIRDLERQTEYLELNRPLTKILALTASAFEDGRESILAAGCDDFLFKPITETALFEKMGQHLGVRYCYESLGCSTASVEQSEDGWIEQALQRMPLEWMAQFHYAARIADEDLMLRVLDQLPHAEAKLARALRELVIAFEIEKLIELTAAADDLV